ncbi:MAG: NADH:flavin oxidoreductase/NADH oxidase [Propionibacteriales bacterium]|nr:NADH:flavin oxidoreductase/NADH oxidase [Propionibacteriales bacterium]
MHLFSPITLRATTFANRVWVSPMCEYSAVDGVPQDWHLVHLGGLARGGAGLVLTEATAVSPEGRISPADTGLWNDEQLKAWRRITDFIRSQQTVPGIQLAHAGRKASTASPWAGGHYVDPTDGGWSDAAAPSSIAFGGLPEPHALTVDEIGSVVDTFRQAAQRSLDAGFEVAEIHAAHGYLLHAFLSPLSNVRDDEYGGSFDNRIRLLLEVVDAVRGVWPDELPLFVRLSSTDWVDGGWDGDDTVALAKHLGEHGVDLVDCSSGGAVPGAAIPTGPGYQVPFASRVRNESGIPAGAVGMITEPTQAEEIVASEDADVVLLARALLRDPHWPLRAAHELGAEVRWPPQYSRARWPS